MSLSFVTKAIQTTAADGTFEETVVENDDDKKRGSRRNENVAGLFDQLRQNQEEAESARLEFQRSIMRGTLALDEDDVAHLQQLEQQKQVEQMTQREQTESQLAAFRAAQAERSEQSVLAEKSALGAFDTGKPVFAPTVHIRKRKRKHQEPNTTLQKDDDVDPISDKAPNTSQENDTSGVVEGNEECSNIPSNALSSLLSGYSSDEST